MIWSKAKLSQCCEIVSGATPRRNVPEFWNGDIAWVTPKDLSKLDKKVLADTPEGITQEGLNSCSAKILPKGALLLSSRAPIGHVAITGRPMATNQGFKSLIPLDAVDVNYLYWCIKHITPSIIAKGRGATFKEVSKEIVENVEIPLPPLEEQKRIAAILDKADAIRKKRQLAIELTEQFLRSAFLDMFGDPITNPKGWPIETLGKICDVRDGTHDSPKYVREGYPLLTSKNLKTGTIDLKGANLISGKDFAQINNRSKVDVGDLVMPMIGTIGGPVLIDQEPNFAIKNVALIKFSEYSPSNKYIRALLGSHYFDYITSKSNRGGTQKFVALKDIRGIPIPVPPIGRQRDFNKIVKTVEAQEKHQRQAQVDTLFSSLQSRAFRGEL